MAPAKTPPATLQVLANEIRKVVAMPDVQALLMERGLEPLNTTPEQFQASYRQEFEVITKRMRDFGIEPQ